MEKVVNGPRSLNALLDISRDVFSTFNFKEVLYRIVKGISNEIRVVRCSILLVDEKRGEGEVLATYEDPETGDIRIDLKKYPEIATAVREEKVVLIQDVARDPLMEEFRETLLSLGIKSILVIPLFDPEKKTDRVIGTLYLRTSRAKDLFTEEDLRFCQIVANLASIALKNACLFNRVEEERRQLEQLAVTDDLTQLYNHRYLFQRLKEEFKRATRHQIPLTCIMLDLDDFKQVNDRYGHRRGDAILQEVARIIRGNIRETDIPARYGGEEFAIILPHTDADSALPLAHRIRQSVRQFRFGGVEKDHVITASFGLATYPHPSIRKAEDLLRTADKGLYVAKVKGKDRVERI